MLGGWVIVGALWKWNVTPEVAVSTNAGRDSCIGLEANGSLFLDSW